MEDRLTALENPPSPARRDWLRSGLAGAALSAPGPFARVWAQTAQGPQLQRLPKIALVIGNGKYRQSPLKNPGNDARAIGETLTALGFEVAIRLDADRATMEAALATYVDTLAKRKCAGLFYYAGHGIQLAWKNYLLPVDANVTSAREVQQQGIELNALMAGLIKAANPFNLVILDACRDNPFGSAGQPEQKGLSQMDAPLGALLAYATAPGNTASDGAGANGLYTENLLKEMRVAEARVEDVFKRVRLAVRRASQGAQIPWESTSLEEDFYFLPPGNLVKPGDAERAQQFAEQLKIWESIETASTVAPFEAYLRRYPSGLFSELAQLQLDRLLIAEGEKPVRIAAATDNPYSAGTARSDTAFRVGDLFVYRLSDRSSGNFKRQASYRVTAVTEQEVVYGRGQYTTDLLGNLRRAGDGRRHTGFQALPTEYALGKQWSTRFRVVTASNLEFDSEYTFRVVAKERITVPAGSFECYRVEGKGLSRPLFGSSSTTLLFHYWMAPDKCRRYIKSEIERIAYGARGPSVLENDRYELESFQQA